MYIYLHINTYFTHKWNLSCLIMQRNLKNNIPQDCQTLNRKLTCYFTNYSLFTFTMIRL